MSAPSVSDSGDATFCVATTRLVESAGGASIRYAALTLPGPDCICIFTAGVRPVPVSSLAPWYDASPLCSLMQVNVHAWVGRPTKARAPRKADFGKHVPQAPAQEPPWRPGSQTIRYATCLHFFIRDPKGRRSLGKAELRSPCSFDKYASCASISPREHTVEDRDLSGADPLAGSALGFASDRGLDRDARPLQPGGFTGRSHCQDLRRPTSLLALQSYRAEQGRAARQRETRPLVCRFQTRPGRSRPDPHCLLAALGGSPGDDRASDSPNADLGTSSPPTSEPRLRRFLPGFEAGMAARPRRG